MANSYGRRHAGFVHRPGRETIVQWGLNDIDDIHDTKSTSKSPSREPAACTRRPSPTKAVPIRPVATTEWRPSPGISRGPHVPVARRCDPAAIPVGIEACVQCEGRLPNLALSGNVIPAAVGVQIGPPIALIARVAIARSCTVCCCLGCGLIATLVPLVPGVRFDVLQQEVTAAVRWVAGQRLSGAHVRLIAVCLGRAGVFNMHCAIEHRDHRWRLVRLMRIVAFATGEMCSPPASTT